VFCRMRLLVRGRIRVGGQFILPSTVANSHFACVFAILVSSSRVDSLDSVCGGCEFESVLVLYPF
jgi:hypothetical protein